MGANTHIFILTRVDQFHESLDDLLFIKPLKGKKEAGQQHCSHLTQKKGSRLVQKKSTCQVPGTEILCPKCVSTQTQKEKVVIKFWSDPNSVKKGTMVLMP